MSNADSKALELMMDLVRGSLQQMDIPQGRRDITKPENLAWLSRNLGISNMNRKHPDYTNTMEGIHWLIRNTESEKQ